MITAIAASYVCCFQHHFITWLKTITITNWTKLLITLLLLSRLLSWDEFIEYISVHFAHSPSISTIMPGTRLSRISPESFGSSPGSLISWIPMEKLPKLVIRGPSHLRWQIFGLEVWTWPSVDLWPQIWKADWHPGCTTLNCSNVSSYKGSLKYWRIVLICSGIWYVTMDTKFRSPPLSITLVYSWEHSSQARYLTGLYCPRYCLIS